MQDAQNVGFAHFLGQTDALGLALFVILVAMSIASWTVIVNKVRMLISQHRRADQFLSAFRASHDASSLEALIAQHEKTEPHARLAVAGLRAAEFAKSDRARALIEAESPSELVSRSLQQAIDEESARLEVGQTLLASVASSAPFVGLFGTVWGIYHALISIGASGESTLDQVAGPVGEALIMTALGLAVAIPAALAYNAFQRSARLQVARLERFAHDLFVFISTGVLPRI